MAGVGVYVTCPSCEWKSQTHYGGPSGRMMGVLTAGNNAEDEFDQHFSENHMRDGVRTSGYRPGGPAWLI